MVIGWSSVKKGTILTGTPYTHGQKPWKTQWKTQWKNTMNHDTWWLNMIKHMQKNMKPLMFPNVSCSLFSSESNQMVPICPQSSYHPSPPATRRRFAMADPTSPKIQHSMIFYGLYQASPNGLFVDPVGFTTWFFFFPSNVDIFGANNFVASSCYTICVHKVTLEWKRKRLKYISIYCLQFSESFRAFRGI